MNKPGAAGELGEGYGEIAPADPLFGDARSPVAQGLLTAEPDSPGRGLDRVGVIAGLRRPAVVEVVVQVMDS
ncbi:hypothetical protein, partial [Holophaga foetida]|uniref:hypothetical protein n=1 Tax=Holophaga foetida TaxID=35839 RepID=UPI001B7FE9B0